MKALVVILALLTALFGFLYFSQKSALTAAQEAVESSKTNHAAQVQKLQTEFTYTNAVASDTRSNLQYLLDRRTADLLVFSNRLVQANLLIKTAQDETRAAQVNLQGLAAGNAVLEVERDDFMRQLKAIPRLEEQLAGVRKQLAAATAERDRLVAELQTAHLDHAELSRRLDDPVFLRTQTEKARDAAALRRQTATRQVSATDRRLALELQPDGTVRPAAPEKP